MIRLHYSNRLENLAAPLAAAVAEHQRRRPLEPISIVVPNRVVAQFVRYRVAETIGVAANLNFPFLRGHLAKIIEATDPKLKILDADELQFVLFECLRSPACSNDPELKLARDYIQAGSKTDTDSELRTMVLAGQLARLFREYSISRRAMMRKWRAARRADLDAMDQTERWQRHLWQTIFDLHGRVRAEWMQDPDARLMLLPDAFESIDDASLNRVIPETLHVFGSSYAGNAFAEIFARLGAVGDLRIYALNPCREFWEDLDTSRRNTVAGWARRADRVGGVLDESQDPFALTESSDPPALRLWGRPGREYIRLLNELSQCDFVQLFSDPTSRDQPTVLHALQQSILDRKPQDENVDADKGATIDARIRFLACPGVRREAEIVANAIWSMVRENDEQAARGEAARMRFHEIAVTIPDAAVDEYLPHIESVFRKLHEIPIDVVSRSLSGTSRVAEAVELLLRLPLGRFERTEMVRLLTHPALIGDPAIDVDAWTRWSEALGIFFGADDDDLKDTYIPPGLIHWDQAIKRLALGTMMLGERSDSPQFFETGDGRRYMPFEVAQDELADMARFAREARSLIADALRMREARLTPPDWSRMLGEFVNRYIRPARAIDEQVRDNFLEAIESIGESGLRVGPVSYQAAHEMVATRVADLESRCGQWSGSGVAIGSFSSLRSIPFKAIFALGMNEGAFPERERRDPLDLRLRRRRAGDVTPAERDRYLFLEMILAARERLFISYIARDAKTGDVLEPSSLVRELQCSMREFVDEDTLSRLTVNLPVSGYDLKYFPEYNSSLVSDRDAEFASFDPDARRGARMLALRKHLDDYAKAHSIPIPTGLELMNLLPAKTESRLSKSLQVIDPQTFGTASPARDRNEIWLPLSALRRFLQCPLQASARYVLGMFEDSEPVEDVEDEPLDQSALQRSVLLREVFWNCGGNPSAIEQQYKDAFLIAQMNGQAPVGVFAEDAAIADRELVNKWIAKAAQAGAGTLAQWQDVRIGRADEFFRADRIIDPILLDVVIKRPNADLFTQRVNLYGTVHRMSPDLDAAMQGVLRKKSKATDFLPLVMHSIALSAADQAIDREFRAIVVGGGDEPPWVKMFAPMSPERAREYLTMLVGDLFSGDNNYFLPIEAVEKIQAERKKKDAADLIDTIENIREDIERPMHYCSSDSGPIRKGIAHGFEPPEEEKLLSIIDQRYGPIAPIFDKSKNGAR